MVGMTSLIWKIILLLASGSIAVWLAAMAFEQVYELYLVLSL